MLDLEAVGRALILAGTLQTSIGDEFTYHEPLVHVPMLAHPNPRRVLIVGGGDGGALRHVLLHPSVEHVVEVEIDRAVVDQARRLLPEISAGAYDDPRAELVIADGAAFVAHTSDRFDVILVDSTDPVGPAAPLVQDEFLRQRQPGTRARWHREHAERLAARPSRASGTLPCAPASATSPS